MGFFGRSLMARLVGSFLLLSILMVAIVCVVTYYRAKATLESSVYARLGAVADAKTGALEQLGRRPAAQPGVHRHAAPGRQ